MTEAAGRKNGIDPERTAANSPLFFHSPQPITLERHAQAGLSDELQLNFARGTNSLPLNAIEFSEACRTYPIVFTAGEDPMPVVLVGLENENYFIDIAGHWKTDAYIPAYVRKYPFALMESPDKQQWILCVDEKSPNFRAESAKHPFYNDGQAAEISQRALDFCSAFQQHHRFTRDFMQALIEQKLLVERVSTLTLPDGSNVNLRGFMIIDEERFRKLPDDVYLEWRKLDWLPLIYACLLSQNNWKYLAAMATGQIKR